jgi:hypothetical protein
MSETSRKRRFTDLNYRVDIGLVSELMRQAAFDDQLKLKNINPDNVDASEVSLTEDATAYAFTLQHQPGR